MAIFALIGRADVSLAAQPAPAGAECKGGSPGVSGFRLLKATASVAILEATQEQQTFTAQTIARGNWNTERDGEPSCGWPYQRTLVDVSASYDAKKSSTGTLTITRNYSGKFQQLLFLASNASFAYAVADLYSNNSLGIQLTSSYGGGLGYASGPFEVDADIRVIDEHYLPPGGAQTVVGIGLGGRYDLSLAALLNGASLTVAVTAVPVLNRSDSWFTKATTGLFLPFGAGTWGATVLAEDNYVRNAPTGFRRNYLKTTIGLTYSPK